MCLGSRIQDNDYEDENAEFDDDNEPKPADAALCKQDLQLTVKLDHIRNILVNIIIDLVEHLVLQVDLISKVLILVIKLADNIGNLVQLLVRLRKLLLVLHHKLLIGELFRVAVLAVLLLHGLVPLVLLQVGDLLVHVDLARGAARATTLSHRFLLGDEFGFVNTLLARLDERLELLYAFFPRTLINRIMLGHIGIIVLVDQLVQVDNLLRQLEILLFQLMVNGCDRFAGSLDLFSFGEETLKFLVDLFRPLEVLFIPVHLLLMFKLSKIL